MAGGRYPCITASVSLRHLCTTAFLPTHSFSLITDNNNNEWVLTPMHWFSPLGPNYQCHVGVPDFYPKVTQFWVHTITKGQLTALSQVGAWGDMDKPHQDMAFLLIVPSLAIRCKWVFGLTAMWMHPCQVCLPTLVDVAQKLLLLADKGAYWPYTYIRMNDAIAHTLPSSKGHIDIMTSDLPSQNACGCLHQLCVWQQLQCRSWVVCPDGLIGGLELLVFNFKELPFWNMANMGESSRAPSMMDVDLGNMVCMASPYTWAEDLLSLSSRGAIEQPPLASLATPHSPLQYLTSRAQTPSAALGAPPLTENSPQSVRTEPVTPTLMETLLHLQGALKQLQWTSPTVPAPISQHSMPRRKLLSVALDALTSTRVEDPLGLEGMDSATPDPMATSSQASPGKALLEHTPKTIQVSHSPSPPAAPKTPNVASISPGTQAQLPSRTSPTGLPDEVCWLQGVMNEALEQLFMTRAVLNSHQRELAQNANIARCQNENQAAESIKEAEVWHAATIREAEAAIKEGETHQKITIKEAETHHATQPYNLEQSHKESVLKLECKELVEEGHDHQAFVEACSTALQACPFEDHGVLMYPLLLLTCNVPLAAMVATTPKLATAGGELLLTASPPTGPRMPAPQAEPNSSTNHLTRRQKLQDEKKRRWPV